MGLELEAKIPVDAHDAVRSRLAAAGAERLGRVLETNHLFDRVDGGLRRAGCGLRVRVCRALDGGADTPATLTFKGPRQPGAIKRREELETTVGDPRAIIATLSALGFTEQVRFEKRRETWRLEDCLVELDEVPYLGRFVEIEGEDETGIRRIQEALGLGGEPTLTDSYISMLTAYCRRTRRSPMHIAFEPSDEPPAGA